MDEDQIKQAWLHGFVKPDDSPDFMLPVDSSALAERGGKVLLEEVVRLLSWLLRECRRLRGDSRPLAALVDAASLPTQIALVAVDLERGRAVELPLPPPACPKQEDGDAASGGGTDEPLAPAAGDRPLEDASDSDAGGPVGCDVDRQADEQAKTEAALWLAWHILKRFGAGELQTYEEMEEAIGASQRPALTRRYVATVRSTDSDIVTARGLLRWDGCDGIRDPLPLQVAAGVDVRCWDIDEKNACGTVQVLRLHAKSADYANILDPAAITPRPLMIDVKVPGATQRSLLELAMPKGWSIRAVLSIGRKLLTPDQAIFTVIHAELPLHLTSDICKLEIGGLIDAAMADSQQLELWDESTK